MKEAHRALIVEDDGATAGDLAEILSAAEMDTAIASNKRDALRLLAGGTFCIILLDLEIKEDRGAIKGHTAHGTALLGQIRRTHSEHVGVTYWLPVIIVSGFAREVDAAVEVMQEGADGIVHKPFKAREVSEAVRRALARAGRTAHSACRKGAAAGLTRRDGGVVLELLGHRNGRRTRILVGSVAVDLPDRSFRLLLRLMIAYQAGLGVHKNDLGGSNARGFKGASELRYALMPALGNDVDIISNDYHGTYRLTDAVRIGVVDAEKIAETADTEIATLARTLRRRIDARLKMSEGNS